MPTTSFLAAARNQLFCEPFDVFDPHMPPRGKKIFNENFRPYRSNINLEITGDAVTKNKKRQVISIDPLADEKTQIMYSDQCDQKKMRNKHRNVSHDSAFHPLNKPPQQYLDVEKILDKPGYLSFAGIDTKKMPLAGKLGKLGEKILADPHHAKHFTTGPWDAVYSDHEPRTVRGVKPKPIAGKLGALDLTSRMAECDNF